MKSKQRILIGLDDLEYVFIAKYILKIKSAEIIINPYFSFHKIIW